METVIMKANLNSWTSNFMEAWKEADVERVMSLLSENIEYYESVFLEPHVGKEAVKPLWSVVGDNQKVMDYSFDVIYNDDNGGIIHWKLNRIMTSDNSEQNIDGVFEVHLDENGACKFFRQWRMLK